MLKHVDLEVERGEKIAFVGKNGEGKTTLAKIIVDELDSQGKVELGHQVSLVIMRKINLIYSMRARQFLRL